MSALIALIGPKIIGVMALVLAALGLAFQQRLAGAKAERNKQAVKERDSYAKSLKDVEDAAYAARSVRPDDGGMLNDPHNRDRKG